MTSMWTTEGGRCILGRCQQNRLPPFVKNTAALFRTGLAFRSHFKIKELKSYLTCNASIKAHEISCTKLSIYRRSAEGLLRKRTYFENTTYCRLQIQYQFIGDRKKLVMSVPLGKVNAPELICGLNVTTLVLAGLSQCTFVCDHHTETVVLLVVIGQAPLGCFA